MLQGTWMRLTRRAVRDYNFRGTDVKGTLDMWANVRRGEKLYISLISRPPTCSSTPPAYEVSVMACYARPCCLRCRRKPAPSRALELIASFDRFEPIDPVTVPAASLLHEFIG